MDAVKPTDYELIELTLAGNAAAYEALFDRYRGPVYAAIFQRCGDELDAGDILQETFVKAYFNLGRFDPAYSFGQWVHTIARNLFIDFTRRKKRDGVSLPLGGEIQPASPTPNPEERIMAQQRGRQLDKLLEELPQNYRTVVELRFQREYSYEEIAAQLSLPIGTVKTQIHRARERLCRLIRERKLL